MRTLNAIGLLMLTVSLPVQLLLLLLLVMLLMQLRPTSTVSRRTPTRPVCSSSALTITPVRPFSSDFEIFLTFAERETEAFNREGARIT